MEKRKIGTGLVATCVAAMMVLVAVPAPVAAAVDPGAPQHDLDVVTLALPPFAFADMPLIVSILLQNGEDDDITIVNITVYIEDDDDVVVESKALKTDADWWEDELEEDEGRLYVTSIIIPDTYEIAGSPEDVGGESYDVYARVYYYFTDNATQVKIYEDSDEQSIWVGDPINDFLSDLEITLPFFGDNDDDNDFFFWGSSGSEPYTATTSTSPEGEPQIVEKITSEATDAGSNEPLMNWNLVMW